MPSSFACRPRIPTAFARLTAVAALTLALGGCAQLGGFDLADSGIGTSIAKDEAEGSGTSLEKAVQYWGKEHAANPRSAKAALSYARNLKAMDRKREALSVLQASYVYNATDREYLSEYGRLALEQGQLAAAVQLLERADDPAKPDWRTLSARGAALAKLGNYKDAIPHLERARMLAPDQPSVLNNLALAYTLDGHADKAETLLRQAARSDKADARVHQNLAMVVGLQAKEGAAGPVPATPALAAAPGSTTATPRHLAKAPAGTGRQMDPEQIMRAALKAESAKSARTAPRSTPISTATVSH